MTVWIDIVDFFCVCVESICFFFFFSSRRRHTRWNCDWSSDVCSSDLLFGRRHPQRQRPHRRNEHAAGRQHADDRLPPIDTRSEERRVGKECRSRGWPYHLKKKKKETKTRRRTLK